MIRKRSSARTVWPVILLGIGALVLRRLLYASAVDIKGLLVRWHPLEISLAALSAVAAAVIVLGAMMQNPSRKEGVSGRDLPGAFGNFAAGLGILVTFFTAEAGTGNYLETGWRLLGILSPVCMLGAGIARILGKKPFFLLHLAVCLFMMLHIVTRYQLWSGNPQLQDYLFSLLGAMALMLFSFYTAAREADCGNPRMELGVGLAAVYLCLAELARSSCPWLYLGGALWVLGSLCGADLSKEEK